MRTGIVQQTLHAWSNDLSQHCTVDAATRNIVN
jgi:hypothetical protein